MSTAGQGVSRREAIVTLILCALVGFDALPSLLSGLLIFTRIGPPNSLTLHVLIMVAGLIVGLVLGAVLLREGGLRIPSPEEKMATAGALVGLAVGLVVLFASSGPALGTLGLFVLAGLAAGKALEA
jgi:hypothetical protein